MSFDMMHYRYPSQRRVVYGRKGMVCTSQPLAAQAGLDMLKKGGNAIDAAIATAACMTVLEPTSNGLGSDAFALVWVDGKLHGLNASGRSVQGLTLEMVKAQGYDTMPSHGWLPVMVPGAPSAWEELSQRFGKLPLTTVLTPAMQYAEEGYPVAPITARMWEVAYKAMAPLKDEPVHKPFFEAFFPDERAPRAGEVWRLPAMAQNLERIGETGARDFYEGQLAQRMADFAAQTGGYLTTQDLADYWCEWVEPLNVDYRGYRIWEMPPNGDGIVVLMALNILAGFHFDHRESTDTLHKQIEALKLAFSDGMHYVTDAQSMTVTPEELLSEGYATKRRALISEAAMLPGHGEPYSGGTVYLCSADGEGNMVSFIQSNYHDFGSGVLVPDTGILLQNRGTSFSLNPQAANCLAPRKKAFHTIIPGFITKDGAAVGPFGVMGAYMQPQGQLQVLTNMIDFHMNPQEALDAPRWQWVGGRQLQVERGFHHALTEALVRKGHEIISLPEPLSFGRGQIIWRTPEGTLIGATEPRADGTVASW